MLIFSLITFYQQTIFIHKKNYYNEIMSYSNPCCAIILRGYSKLVVDHDSFHWVEASSLNTLRWNSAKGQS